MECFFSLFFKTMKFFSTSLFISFLLIWIWASIHLWSSRTGSNFERSHVPTPPPLELESNHDMIPNELDSPPGQLPDPNILLKPQISVIIPVIGQANVSHAHQLGEFISHLAFAAPLDVADSHYDIKEVIFVASASYYEFIYKQARKSGSNYRVIPAKDGLWASAVNKGVMESTGKYNVVVDPTLLFQKMKNIDWLRQIVVALDTNDILLFSQPYLNENNGIAYGLTGYKGEDSIILYPNRNHDRKELLLDPFCFAFERSTALKLGGLKPSSIPFLSLTDLILRASHISDGPCSTAIMTDIVYKPPTKISAMYIPTSSAGATIEHEFGKAWGGLLLKWIRKDYIPILKDKNLVWDSYCGCTGWALETVAFTTGLESRLPVSMVADSACVCNGLNREYRLAVDRLRQRRFENVTFFISHKPPQSYPSFPYKGTITVLNRPKYVIGRSMSETDAIPSAWVSAIEKKVDEIWVPTKFHYNVFIEAGVSKEKIQIVPLPFDVKLFDPESTSKSELITKKVEKEMTKRSIKQNPFVFLSVFKFEDRKGWDLLLKAYFNEFTSIDPVVLVLHTYMHKDWANQRRETAVRRKIAEFARKVRDFPSNDYEEILLQLPPIVVVTDEAEQNEMPKFYKSSDCFVLPTRGEGWGMPIMEAMAMELPVIVTNYSGPTEYLTKWNSYPLNTFKLVDCSDSDVGIGKWAEPSVSELQERMRDVIDNQYMARRKGQQARTDVVLKYSKERVVKIVEDRLSVIALNL